MTDLEDIFKFTEMMHQFQQVHRQVLVNDEERHENDWEHSYQTAMTAWYVVSTRDDLNLDTHKVLKYALAHDLVEVYAGDVPFHKSGEKKEEREHAAMEQLKKEFSEFGDLHESIKAYENQTDPESQFVYALDKIIPLLNIYLDGGRSWRKSNIDLSTLRKHKKDKFENSPEVEKYYERLMTIFEEESGELFR